MAETNGITTSASAFVFSLFKNKLPEHLVYHNYAHTEFVAGAARKIARGMKLADEGVEIVELAAWFHDTGFTEAYQGHEEASLRIARELLEREGYPEDRIKLVEGCIAATRVPQKPQNLLEEIVCDAAVSSAGLRSYFERLGLLRIEWERVAGKLYTEEEWEKLNLEFLTGHTYFTKYAQEAYEAQKQENIRILDRQIRKRLDPGKLSPKDEAALAMIRIEERKLARQAAKDARPERGVATMFKLLSRNYMDLSAQADHKAQTLIFTNALILSFVLGFVIWKSEENPNLAIPGFTLLSVSLLTIIFAVLATRPKISTGIFTRESVEKKQANLMFFGNFYRMSYADYEWGIGEMMKDKNYLYDSLIKDSYYLGRVIGRTYDYLRWSYNIFMYGLIVSIILFLWVYLFPIWEAPAFVAP